MDIRSNGYQGLKWQALQSFMSNRFRSKQRHIHLSSRFAVIPIITDLNVSKSHHQWKEQRKTWMYLEASRRIIREILNVCGIIKGKPRNVHEVNKRKNRRKLGCIWKEQGKERKKLWIECGGIMERIEVLNVGVQLGLDRFVHWITFLTCHLENYLTTTISCLLAFLCSQPFHSKPWIQLLIYHGASWLSWRPCLSQVWRIIHQLL